MKSVVLLAAVAFLTSGCFDSGSSDLQQPRASPGQYLDLDGMSYACPPGGSERRAGVCVGSISDPSRTLYWPLVSHEPKTGLTVLAMSSSPTPTSDQAAAAHLLGTTDGGRSWEAITSPVLPSPAGRAWAFINFFGLMLPAPERIVVGIHGVEISVQAEPRREALFVARSNDRGQTWEVAPRLAETSKGFLGVAMASDGESYAVVWEELDPGGDSGAAARWGRFTASAARQAEHYDSAQVVGPVKVGNTYVWIERTDHSTRLHQVNASDLARHQEPIRLQMDRIDLLVSDENGSLFVGSPLRYEFDRGLWSLLLTRSTDGGRTWGATRNVLNGSAIFADLGDINRFRVWGTHADGRGLLHVVLHGDERPPLTDLPLYNEGRRHWLAHIAYVHDTQSLVHESLLAPDSWTEGRRFPPVLGPDWEGANSAGQVGLTKIGERETFLAWGYDKGIDYTIVRVHGSRDRA